MFPQQNNENKTSSNKLTTNNILVQG